MAENDIAINSLLDKGAIVSCKQTEGQFISTYFLRQKSSGEKRFILNLKCLNQFIEPPHFKLEDLRTILKLTKRGCFFTSIDLQDAFFYIPIHKNYRKYLRFSHRGKLYEFVCMPFGLSVAPFVFTKIVRPIITLFRQKGIQCSNYLDDFTFFAESVQVAIQQTTAAKNILTYLGFSINTKKSMLIPNTSCKILGFLLNSVEMKIVLPNDKKQKIHLAIQKIRLQTNIQIRLFAQFIGQLVSVSPAIKYSPIYIKNIEREKFLALQKTNNDYDSVMVLNHRVLKDDLDWWDKNIFQGSEEIRQDTYDIVIYTDASLTGWGACFNHKKALGWWNEDEKKEHINWLELKAIHYGLQSFANNLHSIKILIRVDNTTALACINKMGSIQHKKLNSITREIWQYCESKNLWIHASYIPSCQNKADALSRSPSLETEWELDSKAYQTIISVFGKPDIDLFASYVNTKCKKFISFFPDPCSVGVDSFTFSWSEYFFYAFPPFAVILRVLNKIITDRAIGIVVVPYWPSQAWYPTFQKMLLKPPVLLGPSKYLLLSPFRNPHPLATTLILAAGLLSGKPSD